MRALFLKTDLRCFFFHAYLTSLLCHMDAPSFRICVFFLGGGLKVFLRCRQEKFVEKFVKKFAKVLTND